MYMQTHANLKDQEPKLRELRNRIADACLEAPEVITKFLCEYQPMKKVLQSVNAKTETSRGIETILSKAVGEARAQAETSFRREAPPDTTAADEQPMIDLAEKCMEVISGDVDDLHDFIKKAKEHKTYRTEKIKLSLIANAARDANKDMTNANIDAFVTAAQTGHGLESKAKQYHEFYQELQLFGDRLWELLLVGRDFRAASASNALRALVLLTPSWVCEDDVGSKYKIKNKGGHSAILTALGRLNSVIASATDLSTEKEKWKTARLTTDRCKFSAKALLRRGPP